MMRPLFAVALCGAIFCGPTASAADDDPINKKLDEAKAKFKDVTLKAREKVIAPLKTKAEAAQKEGKLELFERYDAELKAFEERGILPKAISTKSYEDEIKTAKHSLSTAYTEAKKAYTTAGNIDRAKVVRDEQDEFEKGGGLAAFAPAEKWVPLFNGDNLKGWTLTKGAKTSWKVEKGALCGEGTGEQPVGCLVFDGIQFTDFSIKAQVTWLQGGWGELFVRSSLVNDECPGYGIFLCDVAQRPVGTVFNTGPGKFDELALAKKLDRKAGEQYDLELRVKGSEIVVLVDNQEVVKFEDKQKLYATGKIGLRMGARAGFKVSKLEILDQSKGKKAGIGVPPADSFQANSVWVSEALKLKLTVTERRGETFKANFEFSNGVVRKLSGKVKDGKVSWLAKDVIASGDPGGDNLGIIGSDKDGDKIDFEWANTKGVNGTYSVRLSKGK
jgi:hypothetical protein